MATRGRRFLHTDWGQRAGLYVHGLRLASLRLGRDLPGGLPRTWTGGCWA